MDSSYIEEKATNHSYECVNSVDKEDDPLHDEIFSILFPASPADGTEEKDHSHVEELHNNEYIPDERKGNEPNNVSHLNNQENKINYEKNDAISFISKDNVSNTKHYLSNKKKNLGIIINEGESVKTTEEKSTKYLEKAQTNTELESILPTDEDLVFDYSDAGLSDDEPEKSFNKSKLSLENNVCEANEISDKKLSILETKKNINKVSKSKNEVTKEISNRENKKNGMYEKNNESKSTHLERNYNFSDNKNENIRHSNDHLDNRVSITDKQSNETNRKVSEKTNKALKIEKPSTKSDNFLEEVSDEEAPKKNLDPQNEDTLEDISEDEIESSLKKIFEEISDEEETDKREWATKKERTKVASSKCHRDFDSSHNKWHSKHRAKEGEENEDANNKNIASSSNLKASSKRHRDFDSSHNKWNSKHRAKEGEENKDANNINKASSSILKKLEQNVMKPDKTFKGKYEEIVIIGDERIPKLRVYKNVKIYRGPGLQLKDVVSFVKKCGLHHDKVNSKVIILCVGLNDLIETVHAKDCLFVSKKDCKSHTPCYLFRYKSITHDLIGEMMRQVDKMYLFLPPSYKVTFSCLHLFDLNTLNHNLSQEHYLKFGHDAKLSESDIHNNKKIHSLIKKVNTSLRNEKAGYIDLLRIDEFVMKKYQVNDDINFTDNTQKLMVNNIKIIQSLYSKSHGDESSSHDKDKRNSIIHPKESDIDKTDLRWMLNRRKKDDVLNPRSNRNLKIDKREVLDSEIRRELQTDKRLGAHTNFSDLKGSPLVWHSPGRCISPPGWHLQEVCRKKEEERRDKYKKEKMERTKTGNSEKSISARRESSEINMEKTERNRMERKYKKENMKRTKTEKSERSISARRESSEINMEKVERNRMEREGRIYGKISSTSRISESISTKSSNEGSAKTQIPEKYEHFERHSQKSRSSSRTVEKELDIALCNLREVHDRSCRMYNENPAAHPDYYKEYHLFYQVKSKKIIEIGGNPYEYDFLPEWQSFWQARSKEIFREAWLNMKNQCMQMIEEKKFTQGKHMHEERRVQEDRSRRSESITKGKIMHEERKVQEDRSHRSESVSSSSSSRSSSRSSRSTHRNKRRRSSDSGRPNYKKGKKRSEKRDLSPPIKKKHKYDVKEDSKSSNSEGDFISMKNKLQLVKELKEMNKPGDTNEFVEFSSINNEMLKQILESSKKSSLDFGKNQKNHLPSVNEERWLDDLGLEEVGESVIPFNLGKYVPEKKVNKEEITIGNSNLTDNVLEVLMMLSQLGDKMGSLVIPIKALFDKANQQNMMNRSTIDIFTDPDASILLQLVSSKLQIAINNENIDVIEKVISQELKNRVDKLIKTVEETFVEGVNVEYVAEKSLGMGSSEIVDIIKSVLEISTSSSFSAEKMMKIYKAVKEKQFRYIETTSNSNECSNSLEMAFSMQAPETNNINKVKLSPTEIPFNLPTRKKIDTSEKYDPFEQE